LEITVYPSDRLWQAGLFLDLLSSYIVEMIFTLQMFWTNLHGEIEPFLAPLTLNFASAEEARRIFGQVTHHPNIPLHSLTLVSEDGTISERWFQIDGAWRRKDA
jgi:hypothetical protein